MELQKTVEEQLNLLVDTGAVSAIIKTQLTKTIESIMKDTMSEYSDFGKQLKKKISEAMQVDLEQFSVLDYNTIVSKIVKERLDGSIYKDAVASIDAGLKEYLGFLEKNEYKLSEIIRKFMDGIDKDTAEGSIYLNVEESQYGGFVISFDEEKKIKNEYDAAYRLYINKDGFLYSFNAGGRWHPFKGDKRNGPSHGSFDGFIFKLYAQKCKIEVDEDSVETGWSMY